MRILYLSHRLPYPPDKGEKIRAYHQILHLSRRHEVHLACFTEEERDAENVEPLRRLCATVEVVHRTRPAAERAALLALISRRPLTVAAYDSRELRARVRDGARRLPPDATLVYTAVMTPYAREVRAPRLLDYVDVDSEKWKLYAQRTRFPRSLLYALEARRLAAWEVQASREAQRVAFVSSTEARILAARVPGLSYTVLPMGVDLEYFRPRAEVPAGAAPRPVAVFVGVMDYLPNEDAAAGFARDVLPLVRAQVPDAEFHIVGRRPSGRVRALGRLPGVHVTGEVPDVRPYLAAAAVAVAPFRVARGVQSKVLEALACGLPVVGTPVAFQGLPVGDQDGVCAADGVQELAAGVVALLRDPALRRERGRQARAYVERHHRWEDVGELLEGMLAEIAAAPADGGAPGRAGP